MLKNVLQKHIGVILALIFGIIGALNLMIYVDPMENISLNLSMGLQDGESIDPAQFDSKGWTVYTQEGDTKTLLTPDGYGGFTGLELGQTFYFSRVMTEELDDPTLQLGAANRTFSVWLDGNLIYTDCPEADNRIGYLHLPMNEWDRYENITVTLPQNYRGKTLTIAQSFPEYSETGTVKAWPASVQLYCGYAYESGLISESFRTAFISAAAFLVGVILLLAFVQSQDWSILCLAFVALAWMLDQLTGTSFYLEYFGHFDNTLSSVLPLLMALALLIFLTLRGGKYRRFLWAPVGLYGLCVVCYGVVVAVFPSIPVGAFIANLLTQSLPSWLAFISLMAVLALGAVCWRKESWFYRVFTPMAFAAIAAYWLASILLEKETLWKQITLTLGSGQVGYIYYHTLPAVAAAALITAVAEAIRTELDRRAEKQMLEQRRELALASYEHLRHQHREVMMLRHDMLRHFRALHDMGGDEKRTAYLADLIGQNEKIRPVVESGNEMLDIILNGRLSEAIDAGIRVDIEHVTAPSELPLSDPDLCALILNIVDNAITASAKTEAPHIRLKIHEKDAHLAIVCENSFDPSENEEAKKETVPKHGLGLMIIRNIVERYEGTVIAGSSGDRFSVKIVIPLT